MSEEWRVIPKHPKYEISNLGRMRRKNKTYQQRPSSTISEYRYLKGSCNQDGYRYVKIGDKFVYFTHLVLEAFVCPRPAGLQCDHINRIRDDNRLVNLRWVTKSENMRNRVYSVEGRAALIRAVKNSWTAERRAATSQFAKNRPRKKGQFI